MVFGVALNGRVGRRPRMALRAVKVVFAVPGATPECMTNALNRLGWRVTNRAAMLAPADRPAMAICLGSTGFSVHT